MEPETLRKKLDELMGGSMPYIFAAFDPKTNNVYMIRAGDLGVCSTLQLYIAAHLLEAMQEMTANAKPPMPPKTPDLGDILNKPPSDFN